MTRKQAFLILLLALLVLTARQHVTWPTRFWESPSFKVIDWDGLLNGLSAAQEANDSPTEITLVSEPAPQTKETPGTSVPEATPKQESEKPPVRKPVKKAKQRKKTDTAKQETPAEDKSPDPTPIRSKIPFGRFPEYVIQRISTCWEFADPLYSKRGMIIIQFTHDKEGLLQDVRVMKDTLGIPTMVRCTVSTIEDGDLILHNVNLQNAGTTVFETSITFERGKRPS